MTLRLGIAALVGVMAIVTWQLEWISADGGAVILACTALGHAALAALARRRTRVETGSAAMPDAAPR